MSTNPENTQIQVSQEEGLFNTSLLRDSSKVLRDRALQLIQKAKLNYCRAVEDMVVELNNLKLEQEAMIDLSPEDANSLILSKNFDPKNFVAKDNEIAQKIWELEIKIDIAKKRCFVLFGVKID